MPQALAPSLPNAPHLTPGTATARTTATLNSMILLVFFTATLFTSAFLLFSVQPMVSRMVLPRLGGSPAVWNTCVCFFQAMLLLGYAYADWSALRLRMRHQVVLHAIVLLASLSLMPLSIGAAVPPANATPAFWLLGRLAVTIGPPFFAISATAPLLQHWFSRTTQRQADDPYFLYAASNAGSLLALLSYPVLVEPLLGLSRQTGLWSACFAACALSVIACGAAALRQQRLHATGDVAQNTEPAAAASLPTQLRWVALAFVPSGLMLAVTTYITTDIAAAPLFWVIPLAIYILTFMLAFGRSTRAMPRFLPIVQAIALAAAGVTALMGVPNLLALTVALTVFTITAFVCHFELASRRPAPGQLTRYFLLISIGGALGGIFNALVAPLLFNGPWEYPLLLVAACIVRPARPVSVTAAPRPTAGKPSLLRPLILLLVGAILVYAASPAAPAVVRPIGRIVAIALPAAALIWVSRRGAYLGVGLASMLVLPLIVRAAGAEFTTRSFFGTYRILHIPAENITVLQHGTTLHGVQSDAPGEATQPFGYYAQGGPFGHLFAALHTQHKSLGTVGIIGLGTGALACYAQPGEKFVFREIDPAIEHIARDNRYFHFLNDCGNTPSVVIGDARVTLTQDVNSRYGLLVIDAFSSDSVPAHLLTREALALYFARLAPGGVVAFHISNRYLELGSVVARVAQDAGASARHILLPPPGPGLKYSAAEMIVVAPRGVSLDFLARDGWDVPRAGSALWTDDQSDIARVIRW